MPPRLPISSLRKGLAVVTTAGLIGAAAVFGAAISPLRQFLPLSSLNTVLATEGRCAAAPVPGEIQTGTSSRPFLS